MKFNMRGFFRTLFDCSYRDAELQSKIEREQARRELLKKKIDKKADQIAKKTREVEAGLELIHNLGRDLGNDHWSR